MDSVLGGCTAVEERVSGNADDPYTVVLTRRSTVVGPGSCFKIIIDSWLAIPRFTALFLELDVYQKMCLKESWKYLICMQESNKRI